MQSAWHRNNLEKLRASQKRLKESLLGKPKNEMREVLNKLANQYLIGLSKLALFDEQYEICQVVQELINERTKVSSVK